jgi:2-desacetyl-2-hydroxyethyl bacteriochlorophyllide A dehydrogenase
MTPFTTDEQEGHRAVRAATYTGDETIDVIDREAEPPAAGELQIAVAYTGICGTDLHVLHGDMDARVALPATLGHEMSGTVSALGAGVTGFGAGDPVTVMPLLWCGDCPACRAGNRHICQNLTFVGIDSPGSMQQRWNVPASIVVPLPGDLPLAHAALIEPVAVAVHDVRRAELTRGQRAVVVGAGPIGTLIAAVARHTGADVLVVEPDQGRRAMAADLGFTVLDPAATEPADHVRAWTDDTGADVAFEVSGSPAGALSATSLVRVRGRVVVVAIHPRPRPIDLHRVFWRELSLLGARVYERPDVEEAVRLVAAGVVPAERLITRIVPLAEAATAFTALSSGDVMKVLVDCREDA